MAVWQERVDFLEGVVGDFADRHMKEPAPACQGCLFAARGVSSLFLSSKVSSFANSRITGMGLFTISLFTSFSGDSTAWGRDVERSPRRFWRLVPRISFKEVPAEVLREGLAQAKDSGKWCFGKFQGGRLEELQRGLVKVPR